MVDAGHVAAAKEVNPTPLLASVLTPRLVRVAPPAVYPDPVTSPVAV